ncbi:MAG: 5'-nucleotidase C-terminal domain-containing protein [Nitrospirae bacterium]|nr:5'-nucleotidase C-terminal domain-containing protein [Nitrospirota bacterium]
MSIFTLVRIFSLVLILLFFAVLPANAEQAILRILHVNDFHGFAEPYKPYASDGLLGGMAWLATAADELRKERPALLLSAGDMIQGNNWANLFQGASVIELMNAMQFDAMVTGNHEFDFGQDVLKRRLSEAAFPILAANVEGMEGLKPYLLKEINSIKIAIIGVVTEETPLSTHPRNVTGLKFIAPEDALNRYLRELRPGVDLVVVLSHLGHNADRLLAEKVSGIDVIVGGHSHTKVLQPVVINKTVVLQAWEHGKALGVLDLTFDDRKIVKAEGRLVDIRPLPGRENKEIAAIVEKYRFRVDAVLDETIGGAGLELDGQNTRKRETNLGNFLADIVRSTAGADAAIIGGGSIRTSMKKGDIKIKHVYAVSPFNNYIVGIRLTGRQIREALEHGVSAIADDAGRFPQVSGIRFTYSRSKPVGQKVKEVSVNNSPLVMEKEYIVATDDFLAAGGDGYKAFGDAVRSSRDFAIVGGAVMGEKLVYNNSGKWLRDVVIDHIKERKMVSPVVEGRIIEVE